eukprot:14676832-Alexandrium_andersonii.AAC.1
MVALEQVVLDQGQWQVGCVMSLMEEPPDLIMARRRIGALARLWCARCQGRPTSSGQPQRWPT